MNLNIFRSYDIRGVYGKDLDEDVASRIAKAFAFRTEGAVAVAYDVRSSSVPLSRAFIAGLLSEGKGVFSLGRLPLGAAAFAAWQKGLELAYITASHLASEWNGIKFFHPSGIGYIEQENYAVRDVFETLSYAEDSSVLKQKGVVKEISAEDSMQEYISYLTSKIRPQRKMRVVVECGNGAGSLIAPQLFRKAGFEVIPVFDDPDGSFPNRKPDPLEADLSAMKEEVLASGADFGIAYDGDGDRMALMDDAGKVLAPSHTAYFILQEILRSRQGPVVANVEFTSVVEEIAAKFGTSVIRVPVGHTFMMDAVHRNDAVFGVETAAHYSVPHIVPFDDALAISYYAACLLSSKTQKLSEIVSGIPVYPFERINVACPDERKFAVLDELKSSLSKVYQKINTMDGIRIDFDDGWALVRVSNTEPKIRLTIEGRNLAAFGRIKEEFSTILKNRV